MEETYWCHMCSQTVNPIREIDTIKCPICEGGFVEEMATAPGNNNDIHLDFQLGGSDSDRAPSLWAPILLGMVGRRMENEDGGDNERRQLGSEADLDHELELILRHRRSSAAILQLLQGIRGGMQSESANLETDPRTRDGLHEGDSERGREGVILISPYNEAIILGSYGRGNESVNRAVNSSLGDYFIGPRLDLLLQHLLENDPNRYGTPPAKKEAVDALPVVETQETIQCSICLDECEKGSQVKEMPCKHKFHDSCILPWLELHSSCPMCRFRLPCDESKLDSLDVTNNSGNSSSNYNHNDTLAGGDTNGEHLQLQLPWRLGSLFPSPRTHRNRGNSSTNDIPGSSTAPNASQEDEN